MRIEDIDHHQLKEMLVWEARLLGPSETARVLGVTRSAISKVVLGQRGLSEQMARRMGYVPVGDRYREVDE